MENERYTVEEVDDGEYYVIDQLNQDEDDGPYDDEDDAQEAADQANAASPTR